VAEGVWGGRAFIVVTIAYAVILPISIWTVQAFDLGALDYVIALLPMIPVIAGAMIIMYRLDHLDELQRRIQLHAIGFAALITGLGTFAYSLMERVGLPPLSLTWVLPILIAFWGVGVFLARARYK
jgi:hypothetical protein